MKKSASLITIFYGMTIAIQILGQIVITRIFGAHVQLDAFVSAVTIPTILTTVIAATLSDAFLPILKKHQLADEEGANVYFFRIALITVGLVLVVALVIDLCAPLLLTGLFGARGPAFIALTGGLMRFMLYTIPFTVMGSFANAYLYSKKRYIVPSIAYFIGSIANLSLIIALSNTLGIVSMVVGFITAIIIQLFIVFPYKLIPYVQSAVGRLGNSETKADILRLLGAWAPLIGSAIILRFDSVLTRSFASRLAEGYIVYVNLTMSLFGGLIGIMTIGIQTVFYPHLVELLHAHDIRKAAERVWQAKLAAFVLTIGMIGVILFIAPFFMRLLLVGGKFSRNNVETLISLFPYFVVPAMGWGIAQIFSQPVTAVGKQHYLTVVNGLAVCLAWVSANIAFQLYGGLAAISAGLIVLSFTGIIGAEIIWNKSRHTLQSSQVH